MGVVRNKVLGRSMDVGEIASTAAGDDDLTSDVNIFFDHQNTTAALARFYRAKQPRRSTANDDYIESQNRSPQSR